MRGSGRHCASPDRTVCELGCVCGHAIAMAGPLSCSSPAASAPESAAPASVRPPARIGRLRVVQPSKAGPPSARFRCRCVAGCKSSHRRDARLSLGFGLNQGEHVYEHLYAGTSTCTPARAPARAPTPGSTSARAPSPACPARGDKLAVVAVVQPASVGPGSGPAAPRPPSRSCWRSVTAAAAASDQAESSVRVIRGIPVGTLVKAGRGGAHCAAAPSVSGWPAADGGGPFWRRIVFRRNPVVGEPRTDSEPGGRSYPSRPVEGHRPNLTII
jgi:hypothetical protein